MAESIPHVRKRVDTLNLFSTVSTLLFSVRECLDDAHEDDPKLGDLPVLASVYNEINRMILSLTGPPPRSIEHVLHRCDASQQRLIPLLNDLGYGKRRLNGKRDRLLYALKRYFKRNDLARAQSSYRDAVLLLRDLVMDSFTHQRLDEIRSDIAQMVVATPYKNVVKTTFVESDPFTFDATILVDIPTGESHQMSVGAWGRYDTGCYYNLVSRGFLNRNKSPCASPERQTRNGLMGGTLLGLSTLQKHKGMNLEQAQAKQETERETRRQMSAARHQKRVEERALARSVEKSRTPPHSPHSVHSIGGTTAVPEYPSPVSPSAKTVSGTFAGDEMRQLRAKIGTAGLGLGADEADDSAQILPKELTKPEGFLFQNQRRINFADPLDDPNLSVVPHAGGAHRDSTRSQSLHLVDSGNRLNGYAGVSHGGLLAMLLDEVMIVLLTPNPEEKMIL
ncbi:hypothetical protein K469DRAFT_807668 [Zopfia rhizophila CBS 207.26]|uniref:Uncharacterized protein n=1 Tax=Zopfia rhizophila CBS 207.26 TaxID=1314779 RepID=A0A6A6DG99_9PEZI|nr:hypothetical protein K469DRAFT_807668 [Zopfia rhizophila CBS 207.26]